MLTTQKHGDRQLGYDKWPSNNLSTSTKLFDVKQIVDVKTLFDVNKLFNVKLCFDVQTFVDVKILFDVKNMLM